MKTNKTWAEYRESVENKAYDGDADAMFEFASICRIEDADTSRDIRWFKKFLDSEKAQIYIKDPWKLEKNIDEEFVCKVCEAALSIGIYYKFSSDVNDLRQAIEYMIDVFRGSAVKWMIDAPVGLITLFTYPDMSDENGEENTNYDNEIRKFSIPGMWLKSKVKELTNGKYDLEEFMNVYTWDDSLCIYEEAFQSGVLVSDKILPRYI